MDDRTKTFSSVFILAISISAAGCGYTQQSRFQTSFLPPAPNPATEVVDLPPPPAVPPNPYLQQVPAILTLNQQPPRQKTRGDALVQRAEQTFQRGRRLYQSNDSAAARQSFDSAIDLMLQASDENPADRQEYETRLDAMVDAIHRFDLTGLGASAAVEADKFEKAPLEDILQMTFPIDPKSKDRIRELVAATVSQLPLSLNDTVLGYINYFANRGHKTIVAATERSGRYRPMIQRILDEEGVPQELIHLAQAESGFIPRAVSRKAAGGMWQFLTWRGQQYGLMQTPYTDDRMDPEKATRAAAHHLRDLYTEFGDWYLAIAAYNCGPGAVEKAVERTGFADFWELRSHGALPAETTNYVPIILAMTIMEKNAAEYGLQNLQFEAPLQYDSIESSAPTSLSLISDILDVPLSELAALNPAVLRGIAPANYSLHVPKGTANQLLAAMQLIPEQHRDSWRMHRIGAGETLATIGKHYGIAPATIVAANGLHSDEAVEGDRLLIPTGARAETAQKSKAAKSSSHPRRTVATSHAKGKSAPARSASGRLPAKRKPSVILARSSAR